MQKVAYWTFVVGGSGLVLNTISKFTDIISPAPVNDMGMGWILFVGGFLLLAFGPPESPKKT